MNDDTAFLQRCIDTRAFVRQGHYITGPLWMNQATGLMLSPGTLIEGDPSLFEDPEVAMINVRRKNFCVINAPWCQFILDKKALIDTWGPGEQRHMISLRGATNVRIEGGCYIGGGGDGLHISPSWDDDYEPCRNVEVRNAAFLRNHRQGCTVASVRSLFLSDCVFEGASGTNPMGGLDIEPARPDSYLQEIIVNRCVFRLNKGGGILVMLNRLTDDSPDVTIRILQNVISGNHTHGMHMGCGPTSPKGMVAFSDNTFLANRRSVIVGEFPEWPNYEIRMRNRNLMEGATEAPIRVRTRAYASPIRDDGGIAGGNLYRVGSNVLPLSSVTRLLPWYKDEGAPMATMMPSEERPGIALP